MAFASGSNHSMAYIAEATFGITPTTPAFKPLRNTGTTLGLTKDNLQSEELRSDRQIACFRHGNKQVGGDVSSELTFTDFDDLLEAAACGTWVVDDPQAGTDRLLAGVIRRSFTIERRFSDINEFIRYSGCEINTFNLTVAPNAIVTASFGVIGADQDPSNTIVAGATYSTPQGGCPFDSFSGTILEGGSPIGIVTSIDMTIENSIEPNFVVGSAITAGNTIGRSNVSGSVTAYFESVSLMNKFINETSTSLDFNLVSEAGDTLRFALPNVKYGSGQPDVSGDGSVTISLDFQALYDPAALSNIIIDRTVV
jgi:hypothetical protein